MRFLSTLDILGNKFIMVGPFRLDSTRHTTPRHDTATRCPNKMARLLHALPPFIGMFAIIVFLGQVAEKNVFMNVFFLPRLYIVAWNLKFQVVFSLRPI